MPPHALSIALISTLLLATAPQSALAQTDPASVARGYKAPRDRWGHPDLSGTWSPATITRLERDPKLGERLILTAAEATALEGATADNNAQASLPTNQKLSVDQVDCGVKGFSGVACGYNNFWVDPGTKAQFGTAQLGNFDGPERRPLAERCLVGFGSTSGPPMLPVLYNNHYAIAQAQDQVAIQVEMVHDVRLLRLETRHEPTGIPRWMGDSVASWEGETLVVDTTNFRPDQTFRAAAPSMRVTERFTRISPGQILYQFRVVEPTTFAEPVVGELTWNLTKDHIYEYACHEGNYALPGILAGARNAEKQGREMEGNRGQVKEEGGQ